MRRRIPREFQQGQERFQLVFSLLAAPEIDYFVGRASNLASIESVLLPFTTAERKVVVLHGLGGIGKSQLAIEFAKKHRSDYTAVFWLNAKTEDTLKGSFSANARRLPKEFLNQELLNGPQNEETLSSTLHEMKTWLSLPGNDRWLLIYDNVDNPQIPDNKRQLAYDIRPYFPEAHQGSILVTTRWRTLRIGHPIEVTKLSNDEESISLLVRMSGRAIEEGGFLRVMLCKPMLTLIKDPSIKNLVERLDGLPLALATAGAYLGLTGISVSKYLEHYEKSWLDLHRTSPSLPSYDQTIYSTWDLSYIYIREEDESAAKLLKLWAYFDNRDLWYDLLRAGKENAPGWFLDVTSTELAFLSAIGKLRKHALIESLTDSDGYSMHHCVHAWVKSVLWKAIHNQHMMLALKCVGESVPVERAPGDWIITQRLFPHAERCLQLVRVWSDGCNPSELIEGCITDFSGSISVLYHKLGKLTEAEPMCQRALSGKEKALGKDEISTLATVNNLGNLYRDQGKLAEAESMYQRALSGKERALGKDHTSVLETVNNLGVLYRAQGKLAEAESMYQRALSGREKALGKDHISTLETVNNLGVLYRDQGKLAEAESMYQWALTGKEKALEKDHTSTLTTVNNLGNLYRDQGKLAEAESMYQWALTGKEKALEKDHTSTLTTVNNLGNLYRDQGKLAEAESMYQRALLGYTRNPPANAKSQLYLFYNMGLLYQDMQQFEKVKDFLSQALAGYQELLRYQHADTSDALKQLNTEVERNKDGSKKPDKQGHCGDTD